MSTAPDLMAWLEEQTAGLHTRGVTALSVQIVSKIEQEMARQELTRTELAARAGLKREYVSRILNNPGNITLSTLVRLTNALSGEVSVDFRTLQQLGAEDETFRRAQQVRGDRRAVGLGRGSQAYEQVDEAHEKERVHSELAVAA